MCSRVPPCASIPSLFYRWRSPHRDVNGDVLDPWRLSELLMDVGAMSASVDDSSLGTKDENPIMQEHSNSLVRVLRQLHL